MNYSIIMGRLTRDMEVKATNSGTLIGSFSVAVSETYKKNGQKVEEVAFIECKKIGESVDRIKPYMTKGKQIAICGKLKQDRWEKDGQKFSKLYILADTIEFVGGASSGNKGGENNGGFVPQNTDGFQEDIPFGF